MRLLCVSPSVGRLSNETRESHASKRASERASQRACVRANNISSPYDGRTSTERLSWLARSSYPLPTYHATNHGLYRIIITRSLGVARRSKLAHSITLPLSRLPTPLSTSLPTQTQPIPIPLPRRHYFLFLLCSSKNNECLFMKKEE